MNDITRVEETDGLDILLDCFVVLLLLEQFVSVLLDNLALDLTWEVRLLCDGLSLSVVGLLHQVVNLDVVLHRVKLDQLAVHPGALVAL